MQVDGQTRKRQIEEDIDGGDSDRYKKVQST